VRQVQEAQLKGPAVEEEGNKPIIAVTMGDPAGIGPEIIAKALSRPEVRAVCRPVVIGDATALERGLKITGVPMTLRLVEDNVGQSAESPNCLDFMPVARLSQEDMAFGRPSTAAGNAAYRAIVEAVRLCTEGLAAAMTTAPISKEALNRAGHHYPGHTELIAELTDTDEVVMMLAGDRLRVTLVTIHEPLSAVPGLITRERVLSTIRITHAGVHRHFKANPRLAVLALNPHCGEGGLFGDEEARIIAPAVQAARQEGIDANGPISADTLFHFAARGEYDAVVCMYHDQGLIPLKLLHFDDGVNVTLGLPIIRTSVDHGTAYDLAGTGHASDASLVAAIKMAAAMAKGEGKSS